MMTIKFAGWLLIVMCALVACTPIITPVAPVATSTPTPEVEESMNLTDSDVVALAQADLAERLGIDADQIEVREVRAMTWPDASLGCPMPGEMYAQVTQEGLLIRLVADGEMYFYHSGKGQAPFYCEATSRIFPTGTPEDDEFVPPPGSEID